MIKKILVANREEIAIRIFHTCRVMNISTVAVYMNVDRGALHVRYAEEAYRISSSPGDTSYSKPELILSIVKKTGAAIHPGYGSLPENVDFARRCEGEGVILIGLGAGIIAKMGAKTEVRKIMREAGLSIAPGTEILVQGIEEVKKVVREVGYPIMLKALAGGGGKGMRLVRFEEEAETILRLSQSEAGTSFGNDTVYIEKYIENLHHIEVQIMGDKYDNVVHPGECECPIQRRNQKVTEEPPLPFMKDGTRKKMLKVAVEVCKWIGCYSVGTPGFMMDKDQSFYSLEMSTYLQVECPVTEECTGVDLVRDMITVAVSNLLPYKQEDIKFSGAVIGCHIYAEDPENNFMPFSEVITAHEAPEGRNLRLDSVAYVGFEVSLHYDPMIVKPCCWGRTRKSAISNMARTLREYKIPGIKMTIPFHQHVLKNAASPEGKYDTAFIDIRFDKEDLKRRQNTDPTAAVIAAVVRHYEREKEAASRAITLPVADESLWRYYSKLQMTANNY